MTQRCRLCQSTDLSPVPFDVPAPEGAWSRCAACGSDTSTNRYGDVQDIYQDRAYYDSQFKADSLDYLRNDCRTNCEWFNEHALHRHGTDFLDIGFWHGAALDVMRELGWNTHGFDVAQPPFSHHPLVVRPVFHRWWWPIRFSAVMAREVFEHVPNPEMLLHECHGVMKAGGLFQIQTPRPLDHYHGIPYQRAHLFLASPNRLKHLLDDAMFDVIGERHWDLGQAYLCRARG